MKNRKQIKERIAQKRFRRRLKSKKKAKNKRKEQNRLYIQAKIELEGDTSYENIIDKWLPSNMTYLIGCEKSDFYLEKLHSNTTKLKSGNFTVPKTFSIVDNPKKSYKFIKIVVSALITQKFEIININYSECTRLDLGAQVFFDILLKDIIKFFKRCERYKGAKSKVKEINGVNIHDETVQKLLYSVGSPVIHSNKSIRFPDIIPYKLCIHNRESNKNPLKIMEQKDLDTTNLVDYVIDCLKRLDRKLTPDQIDDLCTIIGEILINAEEHSTTKHRFSIGYFHEKNDNSDHYGVFRLVILNFGQTIYEKFKDPNCPNKKDVLQMEKLSQKYTRKKFFVRDFQEETLWTLYALQEGVTSVPEDRYKKRGNGSIQFIQSFFNLKGNIQEKDNFSKLAILSGNANITFDGSYKIKEKEIDGHPYKFMTFNRTDNIEDKPDKEFVKYVDNYFPGTIISARIKFNEKNLTL